ncbi:hypothetical protein PBRA_005709 [Plasmodiophora brassicae]|uniref:Restriction endonuclease domain-containing protein n=1 Tax=Plasmodiophora brassicae TaxID=37360 RepID=A0A0G4IPQ9_PLABS|nr:hypothetical protein PBRA_005709 [Plasmodiophora brassicae]
MELTPSPYTVCAGVSVDMFNKFAETRSESLPLEVRFLELFAERLVIVELPSPTHESTVVEFNQAFLKACGDDEQLGKRGSSTVQRDDQPNRQSDASYGPKRNTINRIPVPDGRELENWITLAVEVGQTQDWASLRRAAEWWANYNGVQYVLLIQDQHKGEVDALRALPYSWSRSSTRRSSFQMSIPTVPHCR